VSNPGDPSDLPEEVRRFISEHIDSVERLEVLLLLHGAPRSWTPAQISKERRSSELAVSLSLKGLAESGVILADGAGFRIHGDPKLAGTLDLLAQTYRQRHVSVITFIYTKPDGDGRARLPADPLRSFVDAFRIKGDKNNG
jgi:hypothetical protein